jgi:hypothetical protein
MAALRGKEEFRIEVATGLPQRAGAEVYCRFSLAADPGQVSWTSLAAYPTRSLPALREVESPEQGRRRGLFETLTSDSYNRKLELFPSCYKTENDVK